MKILTRSFFFLFILTFFFKTTFSQLSVGTVATPEELAATLIGTGVSISNVTLTGANGSWGTFNGTNSNIGMDSGIILACGDITNAVGPNVNGGITTQYHTPGDPDLDQLSGGVTNDACVLEFDVLATGDTLKFNYVFGSDEYSEYVFSFNDIFAFLISGPGIVGEQNIAIVPGSTNPVSINNVNCQINSPYYICNDPNNYTCDGSYNCPTNSNQTTVEYDGFTTVLTAVAVVQPCQTYHLKLAVADAIDWQLDSGVFIEAGSLSASGTTITAVSSYIDPVTELPTVVEGCMDASFNFTLPNALSDSSYIYYSIGGSAINGTDYSHIDDSVLVVEGSTEASVNIDPISDGLTEGAESVTLYLFLSCDTVPYDSATIYIVDSLTAVASNDTTICAGQSTELSANDATSWQWLPGTGLSCTSCQHPIATPVVTTTYTVTITIGTCVASDEVTVTVDNPIPVNAGADAELCVGQSVQLNASGANVYTWSPSAGLSSTTVPNPTATPTVTTSYIVTGTNGCYTTEDTVIVLVHPLPNILVSPGISVCPGIPTDLHASGGVTYNWLPAENVNNSDSSDVIATVDQTTLFVVEVTDQFGCMDTGQVTVTTFNIPDITISQDTVIYLGNSYPIIVTGGSNYSWSPSVGLNTTTGPDPIATPTETTTYTVTIITADGCVVTDSVTITVRYDALVLVPSGFSPNNDGNNDLLHLLVRGIFKLDHFYVFNRWGEVVFQTNDVNIGWDGKYKGDPQQVGVYVYTVEGFDAKGVKISRQGNISLLR